MSGRRASKTQGSRSHRLNTRNRCNKQQNTGFPRSILRYKYFNTINNLNTRNRRHK